MKEITQSHVQDALTSSPASIGDLAKKLSVGNAGQLQVYKHIKSLLEANKVTVQTIGSKKFYAIVEVVASDSAHDTDTETVTVAAEQGQSPEPSPKPKKTSKKTKVDDSHRTAKFESLEELTQAVDKTREPIRVDANDIKFLLDAGYTKVNLADQKITHAEHLVATESKLGGHKPILMDVKSVTILPYKSSMDIEEKEYVLFVRPRTEKKSVYEHTKNLGRQFDKFQFGGEVVRKGKLVLALMKKFIEDNPEISEKDFQNTFPDSLVKTFGLVTTLEIAKKAESRGKQRYFGVVAVGHPWGKKQDQIKLSNGKVYCVTNQIDNKNFAAIVELFIKLGTIKGWDDIKVK